MRDGANETGTDDAREGITTEVIFWKMVARLFDSRSEDSH